MICIVFTIFSWNLIDIENQKLLIATTKQLVIIRFQIVKDIDWR